MNRSYLEALHAEVREELVRVDNKIGVLLRAFLVTVSVVVAGAVSGSWNPATELEAPAEIFWWSGVTMVAFAVGLLLFALSPITTHSDVNTDLPRYFADIHRFSSRSHFRKALEETDDQSTVERLVDQTFELSHLASRKYSNLHWSTGLYVAGVVAAAVGALV